MSQLVYFGSAAAPSGNQNLDNSYESIGFGTGGGTTVTSGSPANTEGSFVSLGTTAAEWAGFTLWIGPASTSSVRFLVTVSIGGATVLAGKVFALPSGNSGWMPIELPLNVPSGSDIQVKVQSSGVSATLLAAIVGAVRNSQSPPCFTKLEALNVDAANTFASAVDVPFTNVWTSEVTASAAAYDALMIVGSGTGNSSAAAQSASIGLATGAASSEVEIFRLPFQASTTAPTMRGAHALISKAFPAGTRFSTSIRAGVTTDNGRVGLYGLTA